MTWTGPMTRQPAFAICAACGGQLELTVWGEGIDSSIACTTNECDKKQSYR